MVTTLNMAVCKSSTFVICQLFVKFWTVTAHDSFQKPFEVDHLASILAELWAKISTYIPIFGRTFLAIAQRSANFDKILRGTSGYHILSIVYEKNTMYYANFPILHFVGP